MVQVRVGGQSGCAACDAGKGCGAGLFGKLLRRNPVELELVNEIEEVLLVAERSIAMDQVIDSSGQGIPGFGQSLFEASDKTFITLQDFSAGEFPKFVAAEDFTGDGIVDLAVSNSTLDTVAVTLGRGDGTFVYPPIRHFVDEYPQGLVAGDFNKDGRMDVAVSCRDKNLVTILLRKNTASPRALIPKSASS